MEPSASLATVKAHAAQQQDYANSLPTMAIRNPSSAKLISLRGTRSMQKQNLSLHSLPSNDLPPNLSVIPDGIPQDQVPPNPKHHHGRHATLIRLGTRQFAMRRPITIAPQFQIPMQSLKLPPNLKVLLRLPPLPCANQLRPIIPIRSFPFRRAHSPPSLLAPRHTLPRHTHTQPRHIAGRHALIRRRSSHSSGALFRSVFRVAPQATGRLAHTGNCVGLTTACQHGCTPLWIAPLSAQALAAGATLLVCVAARATRRRSGVVGEGGRWRR